MSVGCPSFSLVTFLSVLLFFSFLFFFLFLIRMMDNLEIRDWRLTSRKSCRGSEVGWARVVVAQN